MKRGQNIHTQTDNATTRPTQPRGLSWWNPAFARNIVSWPMQIEVPIHKKHTSMFCQKKSKRKIGRGYPLQREKYLAGALVFVLGKFWFVQKFLGCITYFFLTTINLTGSLPFFPEKCRGISNRSGNLFYIKNINMYNLSF